MAASSAEDYNRQRAKLTDSRRSSFVLLGIFYSYMHDAHVSNCCYSGRPPKSHRSLNSEYEVAEIDDC
jgi:hypothetical protein